MMAEKVGGWPNVKDDYELREVIGMGLCIPRLCALVMIYVAYGVVQLITPQIELTTIPINNYTLI